MRTWYITKEGRKNAKNEEVSTAGEVNGVCIENEREDELQAEGQSKIGYEGGKEQILKIEEHGCIGKIPI